MDPRHRDRVAFVRVCSGRFTKDMALSNSRVGKPLRASRAYRFFGRDRETIDEAYAGDIIGLVNPGQFAIGDTLHTGPPRAVSAICRAFRPSTSAASGCRTSRYKQFDEGLQQLEEEGLMQVFYVASRPPRADRRRRRRAAVRRDRQPAAHRVRRRGRRSSRPPTRRRAGSRDPARPSPSLGGQTRRRRRSAGPPRAAVRVGVGAAVLRAPASRRRRCWPSRPCSFKLILQRRRPRMATEGGLSGCLSRPMYGAALQGRRRGLPKAEDDDGE